MLVIAKLLLGLQFVAAVGAEVAANETPIVSTAPSEAGRTETTVTTTLTPSAGWQGLRGRLSYNPRAFWRMAGATPTGAKPLLLHQLNSTYVPVLQDRTQFELRAVGTIGDVDTAAQQQVFANNETAPLVEDLRVYSLSLAPTLEHQFSPVWSLQLSLPATLQGPLGKQTTAAGAQSLPDTRSIGLVSSLARALSTTRSVQLGLSSQFAEFETTYAMSTTLVAGARQVHSRTTTSTLSIGGGRVDVIARDASTDAPISAEAGTNYFVAGNVGLNERHEHGDTSLRFVLDARVDPFSQALRPTASLVADSTLSLSESFEVSGSLGASTVTTFEALPSDPNETGLNVGAQVSWRRNALQLQGGLRGSLRGPNLDPEREEDFDLRERSASVFIAAQWTLAGERR
jgi:hypothetical protein